VKKAVIVKTLGCYERCVLSKNPVKMTTPSSKTRSILNRALVLAALGKGTCRLILLHSDDVQVMMTVLNVLKVIVPVTMIAHTTKLFNRELGEMEVRHWSLKGARERERNRVFGNAGMATHSLTTVCTLVSHTPASDRRERVLLHEKFILPHFRAISTLPPPWIPHLVDPRHTKMSKRLSVYGVPLEDLETRYGAHDFKGMLSRYVVHCQHPKFSRRQVEDVAAHLYIPFHIDNGGQAGAKGTYFCEHLIQVCLFQ